ADDSAATSVKVGYRQACYTKKPLPVIRLGFFYVWWFVAAHPIRAWCGAESQALLKNYAEIEALQIVCRLCMQARKLLKDYGALFITG
ncbi:hypothetical protein, partial [Janthinobacterium sp. NKUCC08_JDC]|uniref:hypothetical protein n=1 Tax=Janthinobacterium sp. NKUCC08_JDC TaxID=2842122 RepID=UPI001C5BA9FB